MGTPTYQPIAEITLGSSASSVTFSNITQAYRDIVLVLSAMQNTTDVRQAQLLPNGDSGNASLVYMDGSSSPVSGGDSLIGLYYVFSGASANYPVLSTTQIMDYSATDKHKTFLIRHGNVTNNVSAYAARWANTAAISSLVVNARFGGNFSSGTTIALYGILA